MKTFNGGTIACFNPKTSLTIFGDFDDNEEVLENTTLKKQEPLQATAGADI